MTDIEQAFLVNRKINRPEMKKSFADGEKQRTEYVLRTIRIVHTVIWLVFAGGIFYVFYSGVSGNITVITWIFVIAILLEGVILVANGWVCPLHKLGVAVTGNEEINDTYLPEWVFFPGYKIAFSVVFAIGTVLSLAKTF